MTYLFGINLVISLAFVVMVFLIQANNRIDTSVKIRFYLTYLVIFLAMLAEAAGLKLNGADPLTIGIHKIVKCLDYILTPIAGILIITAVARKTRIRIILAVIVIANAMAQVISASTGWTFYIDTENFYHHGPGYWFYVVVYVLMLFGVLIEFYLYGRQYKKQNRKSLFSIIIFVVIGILIQEILEFRVGYLTLTIASCLLFIHFSEFSQQKSDASIKDQQRQLDTDVLTGLNSRYAYTNELKKLEESSRAPYNLVVFSVDVNELKVVNDNKGHLAGDELIKAAADCIQEAIGAFGTCYRTGGDEFIAFLYMEPEKAYECKIRMMKLADEWRGELVQKLSLSIGYAIAREHAEDSIDQLISLADEKMYEAKASFYMQTGKNRRRGDRRGREQVDVRQKEYIDIISALASDVTGLYVLEREKQEVTAYRISSSDHRIRTGVPLEQGFEPAMLQFIEKIVHPDDQDKMRNAIRMDLVEQELAEQDAVITHFRSYTNGEIHYHYMKCMRNIPSEEYDKIIISFCPEDHIMKLQEQEKSLREIEIDDITGLYTKQAFFYHAKLWIDANPQESFTVIISDIHNFRMYNSVYGEARGDELLKILAKYTHKVVTTGVCGRYGADQFIAIVRAEADVPYYIERMQSYISMVVPESVRLKFGVYEHIDTSMEISRICDRALIALKTIKNSYERVYALYDGPVSQQQIQSQLYEARFENAIKNREFVVWYQPKYNPYTEKVVGAEALVRWRLSDGTMLPPGVFLPVFEEDGLISQLDEYVFRTVCAHQSKWYAYGDKHMIPISVNLSRSSMHQTDIVDRYKAIVEEYQIPPTLVPIEITESAAISSASIKQFADAFYEAGFPLHMDDFGSGNSSLSGLNMLHFDAVKLDKSLIDYIGDEHGNLVLMYTIALGRELGLHLVAEGVENKEQLEYLKDSGCEAVQGYYFCKPLPVEEFEMVVTHNLDSESDTFDYRYKFTAQDSVIKRAMDRMLKLMPGGFLTYRRGGDERILSSNEYLWNLFGCESEEEFMEHVGGSFRGMVCPEDLAAVESYIDQQLNADSNMDYVEYSIVRKDGEKVPVVDYGHLDPQPDGDIFYVFISEAVK